MSIKSVANKPFFEKYTIDVVGRVSDSIELNGKHFNAAQIESSLIKKHTWLSWLPNFAHSFQ